MKTIEELKILFSPKDVSYNLTKSHQFQQPLLITLRVADEKPEGGEKLPPWRMGLILLTRLCSSWSKKCSDQNVVKLEAPDK